VWSALPSIGGGNESETLKDTAAQAVNTHAKTGKKKQSAKQYGITITKTRGQSGYGSIASAQRLLQRGRLKLGFVVQRSVKPALNG
jgi:hypothetical protein